jgi:hypothetical protein
VENLGLLFTRSHELYNNSSGEVCQGNLDEKDNSKAFFSTLSRVAFISCSM